VAGLGGDEQRQPRRLRHLLRVRLSKGKLVGSESAVGSTCVVSREQQCGCILYFSVYCTVVVNECTVVVVDSV
jgi:hypothetical protein